jgi:signal transduction histidine kinase
LILANHVLLTTAVVALAELGSMKGFWHVSGIALVLFPVGAAYRVRARPGGTWERSQSLDAAASLVMALAYGIALAVVALIVLRSRGHSLGGTEWLLFGCCVVASATISPLLRRARESANRRILARRLEREREARAFVERLGSVLELGGIRERIRTELPGLLNAAWVDLMLAEEVIERWGVEAAHLVVGPERELRHAAQAHRSLDGSVMMAVEGADGRFWGAVRVRFAAGREGVEPGEHCLHGILIQGISTSLRNAERYYRLRQIHAEVAEADRLNALATLAGGLAHSIRNPLASLMMGIHLLETDRKIEERAPRIRREVRRIDDLVSTLLRLTEDNVSVSDQLVSLNEVLRRCVDDVRVTAQDRYVLIEECIPEERLSIRAEYQQVRLIIANLLDNALTAAGPGGRVTVVLRGDLRSVEVEVRDTGPGIPREMQEKIFELGFTSRSCGAGLGLAFVRQEMQRIGGSITVESDPGRERGTCLRFQAPRLIYQVRSADST